jgi:hypothetical protein
MAFTIENLAPAHAAILVAHTGDVTGADMKAAAKQVKELIGDAIPIRVLSDFSAATSLPGGIELLNLLELLQEAGVSGEFRQALVWPDNDEARLEMDVLRTAETNRGMHAKAFGDRESALAWLDEA